MLYPDNVPSQSHTFLSRMAEIELIAPNGKKIALSTGLFINNEFVMGSSPQKLASIDPA